jgi:hypothetical protein
MKGSFSPRIKGPELGTENKNSQKINPALLRIFKTFLIKDSLVVTVSVSEKNKI